MRFGDLTKRAREIVDKRGGKEALKRDAQELRKIASGSGSVQEKAKRAAEALRRPRPGRSEGAERQERPSEPGAGGAQDRPGEPGAGGGQDRPSEPGAGGAQEHPREPGAAGP
jgi:hypothetical protein